MSAILVQERRALADRKPEAARCSGGVHGLEYGVDVEWLKVQDGDQGGLDDGGR